MEILLRIIACFWILLSFRPALQIGQRLLHQGVHVPWTAGDLLTLIMLVGGVGLLFLKEWARWTLLAGAAAYLLIKAGPSLSRLNFSEGVIKTTLFYGIFVVLLAIPQARAATRR
ncbi:MAG: hypothetical protein K8R69_07910 [Deltaproteobacteria bacterium]|nr:hypothetical protein [Deltaproteobacteria bacterium]